MADFFEVVLTQRAARTFLPDPVDDATVARILTAATHAPSAENSQPFVFVVVRDPAVRADIGAITARLWQGGAKALEADRLSPAFLRDVDQGAMGGIASAPVLIVVCGDTRLTYPQAMDASVFPAVQNLLLAAHALGVGSTLSTLPVLGGDELAALLGLPAEVVPVAVVPLGHLPKPLGPPRRQPLSEKAHLNRYGTPFP
ncbi:MAG TPA: nitroreductase family protein [Acidimicrobiales bacterium]|nr:nitroreductase family protein [Acidimicrobiales bacterium]